MKKIILLELVYLFVLIILICTTVYFFDKAQIIYGFLKLPLDDVTKNIQLTAFQENLTYAILTLIAALLDLAAMVLLALFNLPVFQPQRDKFRAHAKARAEARAAKAEEKKQDRIKSLENELEELKKD